MSTATTLLLINNTMPSSRRRLRQSMELYVPYQTGEAGSEDRAVSITTAEINENKKFVHKLYRWATATKASSKSVSGKGIARLVEKIAKDGRVSLEDENMIIQTLSVQRGWWATLIVMDILVISLATAMLNFDHPPNNGHWSKEGGERILFAYHTLLAMTLCFTNLRVTVLLLLSGLSTFIFEVKGILTFYVRCHSLLVHINFSGMILITPPFLFLPVLAQVYSYGLSHAVPSIMLSIGSFLGIFGMYARIIKPLFSGLYNEEYAIGSYAKTVTSKQTESEKRGEEAV